jgi:D-glycero-alpha-D-manno-heptose 1-phosphate guanylyltransferase
MRLLVLAGGFGTRLQSVVRDVPKALAPVGGLPFLRLQIDNWISQGVRSFTFLLHHEADLIIAFLRNEEQVLLKDCEVQWIVESRPLGTGGAVANAIQHLGLTSSFLLVNADTWLGSGIAEMSAAGAPSIAVVSVPDASRYGLVQVDDQMTVTAFHEKRMDGCGGLISAGLCNLDARFFQSWNCEPFSLEHVSLPSLVAQGLLKAVVLNADFIDIGIPKDYQRFCDRILNRSADNEP